MEQCNAIVIGLGRQEYRAQFVGYCRIDALRRTRYGL